MRNMFLVMQREFITQARKKSFIIITILAPVLVLLGGFVITYLIHANKTSSHIAVIDEGNQFYSEFKSEEDNIYNFYSKEDLTRLQDSLKHSKTLDAVLYIPLMEDPMMEDLQSKVKIYSNKELSKDLLQSIEKKINKKIEERRRRYLGLKEEDLEKINSKLILKVINLKGDSVGGDISGVKEVLSLFFMYIILMFIIIYGTRVMRSVMEEKNNRVVEIIISSVSPFDLMMGKILGTTLVALTQFCIWIVMTMTLLFVGQVFLNQEVPLDENIMKGIISPDLRMNMKNVIDFLLQMNYLLIIFIFIFYFLTGYLFYSSFFAAIGAAVDNDTETQQFMPVIVVPLLLGAYGCLSIINNPEGPIAFWLGLIPFTAPMAMVTRSFYEIPLWQLLLSMIMMMISVWIMIYIAAKIYRVGILMYGKKISFKELIKWIKQA